MNRTWWVIPLLFSITLGTSLRRRRLRSGGKATPRDIVLAMGIAWAFGWLCLGLTAWTDWSRHVPWPDALMGLLWLSGIAFGPLLLVLAAVGLPRLFGQAKKPASPLG
jgi:purine-cytosine permease-like protein